MAQNDLQLIFKLLADDKVSGALDDIIKKTKSTEKATGSLGDSSKKAGNSIINNIGGAFTKLGPIVLAAGAAIGAAFTFSKAVSEANGLENSLNSVANSLARFGELNAKSLQDARDFANEIERTTIVADDQALSMLALARSMGFNSTASKDAVKAAIELSAVTGKDLDTSMQVVGKTILGVTKGVKQYVPELQHLTKAQLAAGAAAKIIATELAGAATSQASTFSGAIEQLNNSINSFLAQIGLAITKNPILIASLKKLTEYFAKLGDSVAANINDIVFISAALAEMVTIIAGPTIFALGVLAEAFIKLTGILIQFPRIALAIAEIISTAMVFVQDIVLEAVNEIDKSLGGLLSKFKVVKVAEFFNDVAKSANKGVSAVDRYLSDSGKQMGRFGDKVGDVMTDSAASVSSFSDSMKKLKNQVLVGDIFKDLLSKKNTVKVGVDIDPATVQPAIIQLKGFGEAMGLLFESATTNIKGLALSISNSLAAGAEGGRKLAVEAFKQLASAFLGPIAGEILGPIIDALSKGPEAVKEMVNQFVSGFFLAIQNIIASLPVLVVELAKSLINAIVQFFIDLPTIIDQFIIGLVEGIPAIIDALILAAPRLIEAIIFLWPKIISSIIAMLPRIVTSFAGQMPRAAISFAQALIKEMPNIALAAAKELANAVKNALSSLGGALGGGGGGGIIGGVTGAIGGITKKLKFADGGIVPGGAPFTDRVPALLTPGELVVKRSDVGTVTNGGTGNDQQVAMLAQIINLLAQPISVQGKIVGFNEKEFANQILTISRGNLRMA